MTTPSAAAMRAAEKILQRAFSGYGLPDNAVEIASLIDAEFAPVTDEERAELVRRLRAAHTEGHVWQKPHTTDALLCDAADVLSRPAPGWIAPKPPPFLWCCHVRGPDDLHACADYDEA